MLKYRKVDEHRVGWRSKNVPLSLLRAGSLVRSPKIQYIFVYTLLHIYTYEDEHSESKKLGCSNARGCRLSPSYIHVLPCWEPILYHTTSLQCFKVLAATPRGNNACVTYCINLSSPCSHQECVEIIDGDQA